MPVIAKEQIRRLVASAALHISVRALKGKQLELSTPKSVGIYSTADARNAVTLR